MKYYSEESIRLWQRDFDSSLDDYPCIEIKEPHGELIDRDYVKKNQISLNDAPVILEASK